MHHKTIPIPPNAELYDIIYTGFQDYDSEADAVYDIIRSMRPSAQTVLDVACGCGRHARRLIERGLTVDGIDVDRGAVARAREICRSESFWARDMTRFRLKKQYDVVVILFASIGYANTRRKLGAVLDHLHDHLAPDGLLLIDPWFEPGVLTEGRTMAHAGERNSISVARVTRLRLAGRISTIDFIYSVATPTSLTTRKISASLGLFTKREMLSAMEAAGLRASWIAAGPTGRGTYVGQAPPVVR